MTTKAQPLTIADWDAMPYGDGNRYEIIEGELFVSEWPGLTHQRVLTNLIFLLGGFVDDNPIGKAVHNPPLLLSEYTAVWPDMVYFSNEQRKTIIKDDRLIGPPALVCEVVSDGLANIGRDCGTKLKLYSKHGVPEYWLVYPKTMTIERWVRRGDSLIRLETLRLNDTLTSEILPGFSCQVSEIFSRIEK